MVITLPGTADSRSEVCCKRYEREFVSLAFVDLQGAHADIDPQMLEIDRVSVKAFWFRLRRPIYLEALDRVLKIAQLSIVTNTLSEPLGHYLSPAD